MAVKAVAAINGGFFNMDDGGSVTYFEVDDSVINTTRSPTLKWGISDSIRNGAIILYCDSIAIETVKSDLSEFKSQKKPWQMKDFMA